MRRGLYWPVSVSKGAFVNCVCGLGGHLALGLGTAGLPAGFSSFRLGSRFSILGFDEKVFACSSVGISKILCRGTEVWNCRGRVWGMAWVWDVLALFTQAIKFDNCMRLTLQDL